MTSETPSPVAPLLPEDFLARAAARQPIAARTLIVVAHPDDETLGGGVLLSRLSDAWIVHVTDGAPFDRTLAHPEADPRRLAHARRRRGELYAAMSHVGIGPERLTSVGLVDQGAAFALPRVTDAVLEAVERVQPRFVLTHPYEGGHPDHDATAVAVEAARTLLRARGRVPPSVLEMAFYHDRDGHLVTQRFLPATSPLAHIGLTAEERSLKARLLACHESQQEALSVFDADVEPIRVAPRYEFLRPPHEGRLHYERRGWGITGAAFRDEVRSLIAARRLEGPAWR